LITKHLTKKILSASDQVLPAAWSLARAIFDNPETGFEEYFASRALTSFLSERGFKIEGVAGLPTAFSAHRGAGKSPCLAFLAEMDALPGLGHACGHHLIAASSAAAAAVLCEVLEKAAGRIKVIGCPAEEGGGGKLRLSEAGVFDGIGAALIAHPDRRTEVYKRSLGVVEVSLEFRGRAAHASAYPEDGINALDAVIQTFNAVSAMRQQLPCKARVHGIITDGGEAPNIVPERAKALFLARGLTVDQTVHIAERVIECAKGAAAMTGARLRSKIARERMYAPYIPNRPLGEAYLEALDLLGVECDQGPEDEGMGSTDVGDVFLRAPVLHPLHALPGVKEGVHTPGFARAAGGGPGRLMLSEAIPALAMTGARFLLDAELRRRVKAAHKADLKRAGAVVGRR